MAESEFKETLKMVGRIAIGILVFFVALILVGEVFERIQWKKIQTDVDRTLHSSYYKRIDFLTRNCEKITGYEDLNDGKTTFKCPNGKEYQEKTP